MMTRSTIRSLIYFALAQLVAVTVVYGITITSVSHNRYLLDKTLTDAILQSQDKEFVCRRASRLLAKTRLTQSDLLELNIHTAIIHSFMNMRGVNYCASAIVSLHHNHYNLFTPYCAQNFDADTDIAKYSACLLGYRLDGTDN